MHLLFVRTCLTIQVKSLYHDAWAIIMHLYAGSRSYILITNVEAEDLNKCFLHEISRRQSCLQCKQSKRLFLVRKKGAPAKRLRVLKVGECLGPTTERNILNRLYKFNIPEKVGYYL